MPRFGRTGGGKWHFVGAETCRHSDRVDDDSVFSATDVVEYDPDEAADQRILTPDPISVSDSGLCRTCRSALERRHDRRRRLVALLKRNVPYRGIDWTVEEGETTCYWCRATEPEGRSHEGLDSIVCPTCATLYDTPLGEPDAVPDEDRRPPTPTDPVEPIAFGVDLDDYDPSDLVGTNRPVIEGRPRDKYASLLCRVERTGHALAPEGLAALAELRDEYADRVADDETHATDVTLDVALTGQGVTFDGVAPADLAWIAGQCLEVVADPTRWFRVGWGRELDVYPVPRDDGIPGSDPVGEVFTPVRLHAGPPASGSGADAGSPTAGTDAGGIDESSIERVTDPGRYDRGRKYYRRGNVTEITRVDDTVEATVVGSRSYTVRLTVEDGAFVEGDCTCPDDATPCKHMVAAFLATGDVESDRGGAGEERDVEAVLWSASASQLRTFLRELATENPEVRRRVYERLG